MATTSLYPLSPIDELRENYTGKSLKDVPTPAAVLDISKLKRNCKGMLDACESLGFGWRAHIKTHKTAELTRLQVGTGSGPANIIVSTIIEAELIAPLLLEFKKNGRAVNLLSSFPLAPSHTARLAALNQTLGSNGLTVMIDHPSQLTSISTIYGLSGIRPSIFIKIDMGGKRAGVVPATEVCSNLISSVLSLEASGSCILLGLYSHAGQSYSSSSSETALDYLRQEFEALLLVSSTVHELSSQDKPLVLSVGATPSTTSIKHLLFPSHSTDEMSEISALKATIETINKAGCSIELHAGVYPTLDVQQLSTHALPTSDPSNAPLLAWDSIAITILAEIASHYPSRGANGTDEFLLAAGSLALGREPCKAYPGWGIVTPWNRPNATLPTAGPENYSGWQVGRISQEHGILTSARGAGEALEIGQKIRVWPNHACLAGPQYGWYLIVDGEGEGKGEVVVDVWARWRGW